MTNIDVQLQKSMLYYLGSPRDLLSHRIAIVPDPSQDVELTSRTLLIFDGPSLRRLNMSDDVKNTVTLKHYGKVSLRPPPRKIIERKQLRHFFGALLAPFGVAIGDFIALIDSLKKTEVINYSTNLAFDERVIGSLDAYFSKYAPHTDQLSRMLTKYCASTKTALTDLALPSNVVRDAKGFPYISLYTKHFIPQEQVAFVLSQSPRPLDPKYLQPTLVLRTNVDISRLNPNDYHDRHYVHAVTAIDGYERPFVHSIVFPGPKFYRSKV